VNGKKSGATFFQATGILVHIGDSGGQRICVSVRYGERQKIEVAKERLECLQRNEAAGRFDRAGTAVNGFVRSAPRAAVMKKVHFEREKTWVRSRVARLVFFSNQKSQFG
jgi:hypothetical protein